MNTITQAWIRLPAGFVHATWGEALAAFKHDCDECVRDYNRHCPEHFWWSFHRELLASDESGRLGDPHFSPLTKKEVLAVAEHTARNYPGKAFDIYISANFYVTTDPRSRIDGIPDEPTGDAAETLVYRHRPVAQLV